METEEGRKSRLAFKRERAKITDAERAAVQSWIDYFDKDKETD